MFDALPKELPRLISIGRLDLNSEGLLLLTNETGHALRSMASNFACDSPLEGNGFELPVPRAIRLRFRDFALARLR